MKQSNRETVIQAAKDRLDNAVNDVATKAQCLRQIEGVRVKEGVLVELADWRDLQDSLGEWRAATQHFLSTVTDESLGPQLGEINRNRVPRTTSSGHTHIKDGHQVVCHATCSIETVGKEKEGA